MSEPVLIEIGKRYKFCISTGDRIIGIWEGRKVVAGDKDSLKYIKKDISVESMCFIGKVIDFQHHFNKIILTEVEYL